MVRIAFYWLVCILVCFLGVQVSAQEAEEPLESDRPDFTEATSVVGPDRWQLESGYTYTRDEDRDVRTDEHVLPEFLLRVGLNDWLELRLGWEGYVFSDTRDLNAGSSDSTNGGTDGDIGVKIALSEQDECEPWLPATALIASLTLPIGAEAFTNDSLQGRLNYLYSRDLTDEFSLGGSSGLTTVREDQDDFLEFTQSVTMGTGITEQLGSYVEWFAFFRDNSEDDAPEHYLNGGLTYLVTPNLQLDWRAGFGLNESADDFFTGVGFVIRR